MTSSVFSKRAGWSAHLTRPVRIKNGPTLRTLDDVRAFILSAPKAVHERRIWHDGGIGAVTEKIELALLLEARLAPMLTSSLPASVISIERARKVLAAVSGSTA
jgi:hypothetical protein